jgi:hypothetical protein
MGSNTLQIAMEHFDYLSRETALIHKMHPSQAPAIGVLQMLGVP